MAAIGKTPILLYGSTTASNVPVTGNLTNSSDGCEIAINVADKNLFFKDSTNVVNTVPIRQSSASSNGWLSSTDWSTFNNKQPAGSYALTTGTLAQFASTTSAQLAGVISDETGSGSLVFNTSPAFQSFASIGVAANPYLAFITNSGATTTMLSVIAAAYTGVAPYNKNRIVNYNSSNLSVETGNSESLLVSYTGDVTVSKGNLVVGTSGKGIDFSATAGTGTSELLNDYEEGTFTPTITASSGTFTTVTATGNYTKIGRQVTVNMQATLTNIGTASGAVISTLPFTAGLFPAIGMGREDQNTGVSLQARIPSGAPSTMLILSYNNLTAIATGNVLQVTATYFV